MEVNHLTNMYTERVKTVHDTWKDVRGRFSRVEEVVRETLDQPESNLKYTPKFGKQRDRQMLTMEVSIIAIGTLTWGFGDLYWFYYLAFVLIILFAFYLLNRAVDGKR